MTVELSMNLCDQTGGRGVNGRREKRHRKGRPRDHLAAKSDEKWPGWATNGRRCGGRKVNAQNSDGERGKRNGGVSGAGTRQA